VDYETRTRRFTRTEYERLIDLGVFQPGEGIELIGGELMVAEPQGAPHYTAPFGWRYGQREVLGASARVTPLATPRSGIAVAQLLP